MHAQFFWTLSSRLSLLFLPFFTGAFIWQNFYSFLGNIAALGWSKYFPMWLFNLVQDEMVAKLHKYFPHGKGDKKMIEIIQAAMASAIAMVAVLVGLVTWGIKQTKIDNRWLPLIDMVVGFIIGIAAFYAMPGQFETLLIAGLGGAIAGLVSAGGYDAIKSILGGSK